MRMCVGACVLKYKTKLNVRIEHTRTLASKHARSHGVTNSSEPFWQRGSVFDVATITSEPNICRTKDHICYIL